MRQMLQENVQNVRIINNNVNHVVEAAALCLCSDVCMRRVTVSD